MLHVAVALGIGPNKPGYLNDPRIEKLYNLLLAGALKYESSYSVGKVKVRKLDISCDFFNEIRSKKCPKFVRGVISEK